MFHMIPVAKNYISLISSNYQKIMNIIEGTVLYDWCRLAERPEQIPQIQKVARKHKAKHWIHHFTKYSKHLGASVRRAV